MDQSGTFPLKFSDYDPKDTAILQERKAEMLKTALQEELAGVPVTPSTSRTWTALGLLGSHDLSLLREALGMPEKVVGTSLMAHGHLFWKYEKLLFATCSAYRLTFPTIVLCFTIKILSYLTNRALTTFPVSTHISRCTAQIRQSESNTIRRM